MKTITVCSEEVEVTKADSMDLLEALRETIDEHYHTYLGHEEEGDEAVEVIIDELYKRLK